MTPEEAVQAFEAVGWFASVSRDPLYILGGRKKVEHGGIRGFQDVFAILEEKTGYLAMLPNGPQSFLRQPFPTIGDAVAWIIENKPNHPGG